MRTALWLAWVAAFVATIASALPEQPPVRTAVWNAERYWQQTPCNNHFRVVRADVGRAAGIASWSGDRPPFADCLIRIRRHLSWPVLCVLIAHEVGHLLGYPHSRVPGDVMYPFLSDRAIRTTRCDRGHYAF